MVSKSYTVLSSFALALLLYIKTNCFATVFEKFVVFQKQKSKGEYPSTCHSERRAKPEVELLRVERSEQAKAQGGAVAGYGLEFW